MIKEYVRTNCEFYCVIRVTERRLESREKIRPLDPAMKYWMKSLLNVLPTKINVIMTVVICINHVHRFSLLRGDLELLIRTANSCGWFGVSNFSCIESLHFVLLEVEVFFFMSCFFVIIIFLTKIWIIRSTKNIVLCFSIEGKKNLHFSIIIRHSLSI